MALRVGFVGWRGMVGSVLMERMQQEKDFDGIESVFFSTSNAGGKAPDITRNADATLHDAYNLEALKPLDIIISCQGGDYTTKVYDALRADGWRGYWIDAASTLRMRDDALIILDPVNRPVIDLGLQDGTRTYVGGNCTVSLMLMGLAGLFEANQVEWLSSMTYQSASGAGAQNMGELVRQMGFIGSHSQATLDNPASSALDIDRAVNQALGAANFPREAWGMPLAANLIPWIDREVEDGQTREEWKGFVETNKILRTKRPIPIDGQCVRVGSMRCHAQAFTIKLREALPLDEINSRLNEAHAWTRLVPNTVDDTRNGLTPAAVSGTLNVPVGRVRKMRMGDTFLTAFSVGDQLLWGAAEPLRRMLNILREHLGR